MHALAPEEDVLDFRAGVDSRVVRRLRWVDPPSENRWVELAPTLDDLVVRLGL